ncbi:MAG: hypothetical protein AAGF94_18805 [Pseudomonadota bacterium]
MTWTTLSPLSLIALPAVGLGLWVTPAPSQQALQYMDDRSTPEAVIQSYYNAINLGQLTRAYGYFSDGWAPKDYASWAEGYADTKSVSVQIGSAPEDPGAGQVLWHIPVAVSALDKTGKTKVFAGCYEIHLTEPEMQTDPPFQPISINKATLSPSDQPIQDALPSTCPE